MKRSLKENLKPSEEIWHLKEYEKLRDEIKERIILLHKTINMAIIFWLIFLLAIIGLLILDAEKSIIYTFLLIIPIIMSLLAFNYQTNQNSLESIAKYCHEKIKPKLDKKYNSYILGWEKFFAIQKRPFRFESVTKVLPFLLPLLIPIYFLIARYPLENYQIIIAVVDIVLLVIVSENFRYKLRRVK